MSRALGQRVKRLERRRPVIERERTEARARFEVDSLLASAPLSASGEPLPMWQLLELFGKGFLLDARRLMLRR